MPYPAVPDLLLLLVDPVARLAREVPLDPRDQRDLYHLEKRKIELHQEMILQIAFIVVLASKV